MNLSKYQNHILFFILAFMGAFFLVYSIVEQPAYPDAFYHMNAANRLVTGQGLTDDYLWTYIGAPNELPAPSHLYWMPMTSLTAAAGMWLFNAPANYQAAQFFLAVMLALTAIFAYWLGNKLGQSRRYAWSAGIMTLTGGFFVRFWGATDTFAPYAIIGGLCLGFMGLAMTLEKRRWLFWLLAGVFAALGHLTRADGLLLLLVGWSVLFFPFDYWKLENLQQLVLKRLSWLILFTIAYGLTMMPWWSRNLEMIGTVLPIGGTQSIWFAEYNDLFNFQPDATPDMLFSDGLSTLIETRWLALRENFGTFIAVEGFIVLMPLMLIGLWRQRQSLFFRAFWIYALGLHLAMTFVFPFPGFRGGLFHSIAALLPFWSVLAIIGLDSVVDWLAKRRKHWKPKTAKLIFTTGMVLMVLWLSWNVGSRGRVRTHSPALYTQLAQELPADSRIMINDSAQLYYFTGMGGAVIPNESIDVVPIIAAQYDIDYLLIEGVHPDGFIGSVPSPFAFDVDNPPEFLTPIDLFDEAHRRLYAIEY